MLDDICIYLWLYTFTYIFHNKLIKYIMVDIPDSFISLKLSNASKYYGNFKE